MSLVTYSLNDKLATITMDDGKANVISPAMVEALNDALDTAEREAAVVVLTGRSGMFSGGFDLSEMAKGMDAAAALVQSGSALAKRLLAFPLPVIGASSGHAIAMGSFLLLSCDHRIGLDGEFKYALNEVAIGLTMHHVGIELARDRLTRRHFNRAVMNAELFTPRAAVEAGFLDQVVEADHFAHALKERAALLAGLNSTAFKHTKRKARQTLFKTLDWAMAEDAEEFKKLIAAS